MRDIPLRTMAIALAASVGLAAPPALAEDAPAAKGDDKADAPEVGEILVLGRGYDNGFAGDKALATVRATPSSVTVIDAVRIEKQRLVTLDDVLKQTAGVTVVRNVSTYPRFFARGFQVSSFLFDGTPQQGFAEAPYSMPDLFLFDGVEFLRGPSALFSGSGSPGGSVNLVRKRPKGAFAFTGSVSAGSWDFYRAEVDLSTPLNSSGTVRARAGALVQDAGEFIDNFQKDRSLGFASIDFDLGAATTLSLGGYHDDFRTTIQTGLPANRTTGLLDLPRSTYLGGDDNEVRTKQSQLYGQLSHEFSDRWKARATVQYNDLRRKEFYLFARGPVDDVNQGILNLETFRGSHKADALSGDASLVGEFDLFGNVSGIILGADYQRSKWNFASNYAFEGAPPLLVDVFNPHPVAMPTFPLGPTGSDYFQGSEEKEQYGFYGQTRLKLLPSFTVVAGGRVGWVTYTTKDFDLTPNGVYSVKGKISPYVGLVYDFAEKWTLYGSYADVFEPQSAFDKNGDPLGPVSGTQFETGVKTNVFSDRFLLTAAVYRIRQSNRAVADPTDINASIASGLVQGKGFEIELNGHIMPNWSISGGYNYNRNKVLSDTDPALVGTQIAPVTPKHSVKLFTDYSFTEGALEGLSVGGAITLSSKQRGTGVEQDGYFVADLRAGYDVSELVNLSINVNNIFDKKYYSELRDRRFSNWYGAPRSAFVTVRAKY